MQFIDTIDVKGQEYQFQASYDSDGNHIVTTYAKHTYVDNAIESAITDLIDSAPEALNTLKEISASLNDDADFAGTMTTELAKKANAEEVYTKTEVDNIKKSIDSDILSNVNALSGVIVKKIDATDVYTKDETYTKEQVNTIALTKANASDSYTKDQLYTKTEVDSAFSTLRSELPTKVSAFENDSEYLVWSQVEHFAEAEAMNTALDGKVDKEEGMGLISNENTIKLQALPTAAQYEAQMQAYQETLSTCTAAVQAMGTNIDGAMQKNDAQDATLEEHAKAIEDEIALAREEEGKLAEAISTLQNNKVDIVEGMGLSSNDYTAEDKELLQDLSGRVEALELATAVLEQFEALVTKVGELEAKIAELEAKHAETPEEPDEPEAEPEA